MINKSYTSPEATAYVLLQTKTLPDAIIYARVLYSNSRSDDAKAFWLDTKNILIEMRNAMKSIKK